ncbi:MAG TPA: MMPL family transporter, partial [Flavitalea sp.]|nr:MMPL family transporter [Flavitalea sp.]
MAFLATRLKFEEDITAVLPKEKNIEKLNEIFQNSKFMDRLVLMVAPRDSTVDDPDQLVAFADSLSALIAARLDPYVTRINGRVDDALMIDLYGNISEQLPVYLTESDYKIIDTLITPQRLRESLQQNIRTLSSPAGIALKSIITKDPVGISLLGVKKLQQLQYDESFELYDGYVMTKDRKNLLLFLTPRFPPTDSRKNGVFIHSLEEIIASTQGKFPTVEAQYFGATAVSLGNAVQLTRDTLLTQGIILLFLIIFLGLYFRRKSAPLVILIPVVFGTLFSLMFIYIIRGKISLIAFGTASVVLSIAVNYSLHLFNHFRHTGDMEQVIRDLARPLTIGSITTIGGFLCLQFVESEMLRDLGLFAALSLTGAIICSLVFLPPLIKRSGSAIETIRQHSWLDRIAEYRPEYNKYLVLFILALTVVLAYFARNVQFESDLVKMNYMSAKLKQAESKLNQINRYALQSVYLVTQGNTLDEALALNEKQGVKIATLKEQGIVTRYSGVSSLILSDSLQKLRIDRWNRYWTPEKKLQV